MRRVFAQEQQTATSEVLQRRFRVAVLRRGVLTAHLFWSAVSSPRLRHWTGYRIRLNGRSGRGSDWLLCQCSTRRAQCRRWVRRDRGEAAGWSGNVRYGPDSDRIGFVAVNDVMGHKQTSQIAPHPMRFKRQDQKTQQATLPAIWRTSLRAESSAKINCRVPSGLRCPHTLRTNE
jgi:hypothetical protein